MGKAMDLYTDYLLSSFGQVTATGLSSILDGSISHNKITRMLSGQVYGSKEYLAAIGTHNQPVGRKRKM